MPDIALLVKGAGRVGSLKRVKPEVIRRKDGGTYHVDGACIGTCVISDIDHRRMPDQPCVASQIVAERDDGTMIGMYGAVLFESPAEVDEQVLDLLQTRPDLLDVVVLQLAEPGKEYGFYARRFVRLGPKGAVWEG